MSTISVSNIKKTGETASRDVSGVAAAWVNFNGTGTVAIRDSMNVSSLTDVGTGNYSVNLSNNMVNSNYVGHANVDSADIIGNPDVLSASSWTMRSYYPHGTTYYDPNYAWSSIHGDLA